jgi:hypothetical protein
MTNKDMFEKHFHKINKLEDLTIKIFIFNLMNLFLKMTFLFFKEMLLSMCVVT